jgi:hypothetical protein
MAKNYALFFGGADEAGEQNQFLYGYSKKTDSFVKAGWQTQILYGDQAETDYLVKKVPKLSGKVKPSTKENIFEYLDSIINNGSSGDQLLLNLNGHGGIGRFINADGDFKYDDPEFLARLNKINDKGLKVSIVLDTCFSGSAVPILKDYACVVSSQTNNMTSYGGSVMESFDKLLGRPDSNMNDFYLQMLSLSSKKSRVIPMTSASSSNEFLASVSTGLFRFDSSNPSTPAMMCYGAEAIKGFESGFGPMLNMLDSESKYKKICQIFGQQSCKKQPVLAAQIKKIKVTNIDKRSEDLQKLSDEKLLQKSNCNQALGGAGRYEFHFDLSSVADKKDTETLALLLSQDLIQRTPDVSINPDEIKKSGNQLSTVFWGSACDLGTVTSPESIENLTEFYANFFLSVAKFFFKAKSKTELKTMLKKMFTKGFNQGLPADLKLTIAQNRELLKNNSIAGAKYLDAFTDFQEILKDVGTAEINQALAYNFLNEADHVSEKDKEYRQRCEDFKLK